MDADGLPIVGPGIDLTKASFLLAVRQGLVKGTVTDTVTVTVTRLGSGLTLIRVIQSVNW